MEWSKETNYLPKDEVAPDNAFDRLIAPNISIQNLTRKLGRILNVDHKPFVQPLSFVFSLDLKILKYQTKKNEFTISKVPLNIRSVGGLNKSSKDLGLF